MIKKNSPVESSTLSEKCSPLSRTSYMTFQRVKSTILELMKYVHRPTRPTSMQCKSLSRSKSWERHLRPNKRRLGTTLKTDDERACLKRSILRSVVGIEMLQVRSDLSVRICIKDLPWSILLPSNKSSWLVTSSSSCTVIRIRRKIATFRAISRDYKCQATSKP